MKGTALLILEFLINTQSHFNQMILMSFHGKMSEAIKHTNDQWLMFDLCLNFFSIWDAGEGKDPISFLPYVLTVFFVTVGLMYSSKFVIFGI